MHCDYQLTYCPILHIVTMAFRDNAFENERLTPDLVWKLRVPKRLPSLPLRWKKNKLKLPVLRRMKQTPHGVEVDPTLPMTYDSSNLALKHIGEGLGYEDPPDHYNFRRWAANEVNRRCSFPFLLYYLSFGCQSGAFTFPLSRFPTPILMFSTSRRPFHRS
jgi:hypothetical protein